MIAILVAVLVVAKNGRHSGAYAFGHFESYSGWPDGWAFFVGLLHAGYCTSTTGMVITMCEEVHQPATQVPKAIVGTVAANLVLGLAFLIPLTFILPDIEMLAGLDSGAPVPVIVKSAVGPKGAMALMTPILVLGLLCGVTCTTSASRCTWAFARDGAIPGSRWWRQVHPKLNVPLNAMMLSMTVQILLGIINFGSSAALNAFLGVCIICLTASYAMPIAVSVATGRKAIRKGRFNLGKFGLPVNIVALGASLHAVLPSRPSLSCPSYTNTAPYRHPPYLRFSPILPTVPCGAYWLISAAWSLFAIPLFCMPTEVPVTPATVNYAPVVFAGAMLISGVWYLIWGYRHYEGPPTHDPAAF